VSDILIVTTPTETLRLVGSPSSSVRVLVDRGQQGAAGPAGPGVNWRRDWDSETAYVAFDGVYHDGTAWVTTEAVTGGEPGVDAAWSRWFETQPGEQGPAGADGADGADGAPGDNGAPGANGSNGEDGADGADGADGDDGWSPVFAVVSDEARRVLQVTDWVGGQGAKPSTGQYVGAVGLTATLGEAVDVRGSPGAPGADGADGEAGAPGADGADGEAGVVAATAPILYDSGTQTVSADLASQGEAETGSAADKLMTPQRTAQAIAHLRPLTPTVGSALGTTGTVDLDMAALHGTYQTIALSGALTLTTSNRAAGRSVTLRLAAGGGARALTFPGWVFVGAAAPTTLASGKVGILTVTFFDTSDAAAVAAWAAQP